MLPYIDTHAHLSMLTQRGCDVRKLVSKLFAGGFGGIIDVGTKAGDLASRLAQFGDFPRLRFSAGIWPSAEAVANRKAEIATLAAELDSAPPGTLVALGECGIDRHWNRREYGSDLEGERELLDMQLRIAEERNLPVIIHSRDAAEETAEVLSRRPLLRGVIHCYSYGPAQARYFLDLGLYLSFSGTLTYKNAREQRDTVAAIPEERLLIETDSPYLAPMPHRGAAADPGMVSYAYRLAAELRGVDEERLVRAVAENVSRLFGFPTQSL